MTARLASRERTALMLPTSYRIQKIGSNVQYFFWGMGRPSQPIPLGQIQVIRPVVGTGLGVDLDQLRVRFTPATGQVYGPPTATTDVDPETNQRHEMVPLANRVLNQNSPWVGYRMTNPDLNHPIPADTYDG